MPKTDDIDSRPPSAWIPETNVVSLAVLNKLQEELNEAGAIIARMLVQGVDERNPDTGEINRDALQDELADVHALVGIAVKRFDLNAKYMNRRSEKKTAYIGKWLDDLKFKFKEGNVHERI